MNRESNFITGREHAPILADGTFRPYREILTPDSGELIGREYPNENFCWFNLTRAALNSGFSHDEIWNAETESRELYLNPAYIDAHKAELLGVRS
jgi:hypothetical protein